MKKASLLQLMPYTIKEKAQDDSLSGGISSCSMSDDSVSKGGSPLDVKEKSKLQQKNTDISRLFENSEEKKNEDKLNESSDGVSNKSEY